MRTWVTILDHGGGSPFAPSLTSSTASPTHSVSPRSVYHLGSSLTLRSDSLDPCPGPAQIAAQLLAVRQLSSQAPTLLTGGRDDLVQQPLGLLSTRFPNHQSESVGPSPSADSANPAYPAKPLKTPRDNEETALSPQTSIGTFPPKWNL